MQVEPFAVECNTDDATLNAQVAENSARSLPWVADVEEHDGHALICGSGPSIADNVELIRKRQALGQKVFALNGAAKFLASHGIDVDYCVMVDARAENKRFIGWARHYLLAAQCHPCVFEGLENVTLWHSVGVEAAIPATDKPYSLIGGGTTVGLSAMCLAYTMGYRKLHLFGYDSSHREKAGHAFKQSLNDNDPLCWVTFNNKRYRCSLAMAKQAELFPILSEALLDRGVTITVDGDGLLPDMVRWSPPMPEPELLAEQEKYRRMWDIPAYRDYSPGQEVAALFCIVANPARGSVVVDFGTGTGRGAYAIALHRECSVHMVDFAENCLDAEVRAALCDRFTFRQQDLTEEFTEMGDVGFCTDVMEHIHPDSLPVVLKNIWRSVKTCFFQISTVPDNMGALIGQDLHLTVQGFDWWREKLSAYGDITWSQDHGNTVLFHVSFT